MGPMDFLMERDGPGYDPSRLRIPSGMGRMSYEDGTQKSRVPRDPPTSHNNADPDMA